MASSTKIRIPKINTINEARSSGALTTTSASTNSIDRNLKELINITNSIKNNQITEAKKQSTQLINIDKNLDKNITEFRKAYGSFVTISSSTTSENSTTPTDYDSGTKSTSRTTTRTKVSSFTDSGGSSNSGHAVSHNMSNRGITDGIKSFGDRASSGFAPSLALSIATGGVLNPILIQALWGPLKQAVGLIKDVVMLPFKAISAVYGSMKNVWGFITSPFHSFGHSGGSNSEYGLQGETKATTNARDNQLYRRLDTIIGLLGKKPALEKEEKKEKSGGFLSSLFGFLGEAIKIGGLIALGYGIFKVLGMDRIKKGWEAIKESKQKDGWWGAIKTTLSTVVDWGKIIGGFIYDWYEESGLKDTISGFIEGVKQDIKDWWDKDKEREKDPNQFSIHRVFTWINEKISGILGEGWSEVWNNTLLSLSSGWNILTDDKAADKYFENIDKYWDNETRDWKENTPEEVKNYDKIFELMDEKGLTGSQLKLSFKKFKKNINSKITSMYADSTKWLSQAFAPMFGDNSPESEAFKKFQLMDFEKGQTGNLDNYDWSDKAFYNIYKTTNDFMNNEEEGAFSLPNIKKTFDGFMSFSITSLIQTGIDTVKDKWNEFTNYFVKSKKQYSDYMTLKNTVGTDIADSIFLTINDNPLYKINKTFTKITEDFTSMFTGKEGEKGFIDSFTEKLENFWQSEENKSIWQAFSEKFINAFIVQLPEILQTFTNWANEKISTTGFFSGALLKALNAVNDFVQTSTAEKRLEKGAEQVQKGKTPTEDDIKKAEKDVNTVIESKTEQGWLSRVATVISNAYNSGKQEVAEQIGDGFLAIIGGAGSVPFKLLWADAGLLRNGITPASWLPQIPKNSVYREPLTGMVYVRGADDKISVMSEYALDKEFYKSIENYNTIADLEVNRAYALKPISEEYTKYINENTDTAETKILIELRDVMNRILDDGKVSTEEDQELMKIQNKILEDYTKREIAFPSTLSLPVEPLRITGD